MLVDVGPLLKSSTPEGLTKYVPKQDFGTCFYLFIYLLKHGTT